MSALSKLSFEELEMIRKYIIAYGDSDAEGNVNPDNVAPMQTILAPWNEAKNEMLFDLFGKELILSKEVEFIMGETELTMACEQRVYAYGKFGEERDNDTVYQFYKMFREELTYTDYDREANEWRNQKHGYTAAIANRLSELVAPYTLARNIYTGDTFFIPDPKTGKEYKVQHGCKAIKAIAKIATMYDIPGVEDFRIAHSQILNQKKLKGTLCLSIHPLDYMTMSDNNCDWDSCMSWWNAGAYRQGTVEMMNSPMAVVAYLRASDDMYIPGGKTWNSKKWRELIVVNEDIITNVKGYPYINESLTNTALDWIRELAAANSKLDYHAKKYAWKDFYLEELDMRIIPQANIMYNDFSSAEPHWAWIGSNYDWDNDLVFNYSGPSECMMCGDTYIYVDTESRLFCGECETVYTCDLCGDRISRFEYENNIASGYHTCDYCFGERCVQDAMSEDYIFDEDAERIAVRYDDIMIQGLDLYIDMHSYSTETIAKKILNEGCSLYEAEYFVSNPWGGYTDRITFVNFEEVQPWFFECSGYNYEEFKNWCNNPEGRDTSPLRYMDYRKVTDGWEITKL